MSESRRLLCWDITVAVIEIIVEVRRSGAQTTVIVRVVLQT